MFLHKRAQIFVADVWGAFGGAGPGAFRDIARLTTFADYRCLRCSAARWAPSCTARNWPGAAEVTGYTVHLRVSLFYDLFFCRVPVVLRQMGILVYSAELAAQVPHLHLRLRLPSVLPSDSRFSARHSFTGSGVAVEPKYLLVGTHQQDPLVIHRLAR